MHEVTMSDSLQAIRTIVASSLDWDQAHATFDAAVNNLPPSLRGRRPDNFPHSAWELVEHLRIATEDLADYMESADHPQIKWPDDYWPASPEPPTAASWDQSIAAYRRDIERLKALALRQDLDLAATIPWGEWRTYLRTILVAVDHNAYHVGQIVMVRRLLGAWP
jgi:uncharacterized damage-inducible protein DinB